jgi:hypothetical protein
MAINAEEVTAPYNRPNPLHEYPSYTYSLSLHLLSVDDYNGIVDGNEYTPTNVLISSAGRWNEQSGASAFNRNTYFGEDFYFQSLDIKSFIGLGEANRSTNTVDIKFNLIEPYGLTLLNRLLAASDDIGQPWNYLANPYLLQIDFFGSDDDGNLIAPIPNITKRIPIRILQINTKLSSRGSEYHVTAIPFNHQAFDETLVSTPVAMEITAGTVAGFFKASSETVQITQPPSVTRGDGTIIPSILISNYKEELYKAKSYADALNAYMIQLERTNKVKYANRYDFAFDQTIGESVIFAAADDNSPKTVPMADVASAPILRQGGKTSVLNFNQRILPISYATPIDNVIAMIIRNSEYVRSQLAIPDGEVNQATYQAKLEANKDKPLNWFKIIPQIKLLNYDESTNTFAKLITYSILPYEVSNVRMIEAPQGKADRKYAVKYYNYIYTGENDDIIELDLEFNAAYYTAKTAYKTTEMSLSGVDSYYDTGSSCEVVDPNNTRQRTLTPKTFHYRLPDQRQVATGGAKSAADITAADLAASLASQSVADMIRVRMKIIGDPEYIKQDDIFYSVVSDNAGWVARESRVVTENGSLITDTKEVLVDLTFRTPADMDDETGEIKYDDRFNSDGYTGLYHVIAVDSTFEAGKFIQTLDMVRYPDQGD